MAHTPKSLIRRKEEFFLAEALIDLRKLTPKPLSASLVFRQLEEEKLLEITKAVKSMTYRFLHRLEKLDLIEPYYKGVKENLKIRYLIFTVTDECVRRLQEEIDDFRSKIG